MTSDESTRRLRRTHAIEKTGSLAFGISRRAGDDVETSRLRAWAAMLAEVEENLCRKIGERKP